MTVHCGPLLKGKTEGRGLFSNSWVLIGATAYLSISFPQLCSGVRGPFRYIGDHLVDFAGRAAQNTDSPFYERARKILESLEGPYDELNCAWSVFYWEGYDDDASILPGSNKGNCFPEIHHYPISCNQVYSVEDPDHTGSYFAPQRPIPADSCALHGGTLQVIGSLPDEPDSHRPRYFRVLVMYQAIGDVRWRRDLFSSKAKKVYRSFSVCAKVNDAAPEDGIDTTDVAMCMVTAVENAQKEEWDSACAKATAEGILNPMAILNNIMEMNIQLLASWKPRAVIVYPCEHAGFFVRHGGLMMGCKRYANKPQTKLGFAFLPARAPQGQDVVINDALDHFALLFDHYNDEVDD